MQPAPQIIPISDPSHVGDARRRAVQFAEQSGLTGDVLANVALIVNELSTNLVKHARDGRLLLQADADGVLEILSLDKGPGMRDVERCLEDGFSTAGSRGMGLSAIRRLAAQWDIYSLPDVGTVQLARLGTAKGLEAATLKTAARSRVRGVSIPYPGETVCGDAWSARTTPTGLTVVVADGLGHGASAHAAASEALRVFHSLEDAGPARLLTEMHQALRATRGAAVSVAAIDLERRSVTYAGVGNIAGFVATPGGQQRMVSINGTLGAAAAKPREFSYELPRGAMVVLYSDGLLSQTGTAAYPGLIEHDPALAAAVLYRDFTRGKDDATVVAAAS
jgi:anti-sigma regulatory factor (Ser/Thr protein kinase)/serine/threonine protein phosphatase PrpC